MKNKTLISQLLCATYDASGTAEPIERYFASMFAGYYSQTDSQPSYTAVQRILLGKSRTLRKLLNHYRDPRCPRCPEKLAQDLSALADCCFAEATHRESLRKGLADYLQILPQADRDDLLNYISSSNLIGLWTGLTWYALCGDHSG